MCSPTARLLFIGLWSFCDDGGVHPASIKRLKMEVFPADAIDDDAMGKLIGELVRADLVREFNANGERFWHVTGWNRHQRIDKPTIRHPRPPDRPTNSANDHRAFDESSTNARRDVVESSPTDWNGKEGEWNGPGREESGAAVAADHDGGEKDHQEVIQEVEPQLLEWLQWWNRLKADSLVAAGVSETNPSQGVLKAWKRSKRDKALVELLCDREAIKREIRASAFCRESWFRLEKLFAGTNKDGEFIIRKLIDGAYRDTKGTTNGQHGSRARGPIVGPGQAFDSNATVTGL